jgi:hypothetical protein
MKLLLVVSNPKAAAALAGLAEACRRKPVGLLCFFTGAGVSLLDEPGLQSALAHAERAVVCEHSWQQFAPDRPPPIEQGSQTDHSSMVGEASRLVSL